MVAAVVVREKRHVENAAEGVRRFGRSREIRSGFRNRRRLPHERRLELEHPHVGIGKERPERRERIRDRGAERTRADVAADGDAEPHGPGRIAEQEPVA